MDNELIFGESQPHDIDLLGYSFDKKEQTAYDLIRQLAFSQDNQGNKPRLADSSMSDLVKKIIQHQDHLVVPKIEDLDLRRKEITVHQDGYTIIITPNIDNMPGPSTIWIEGVGQGVEVEALRDRNSQQTSPIVPGDEGICYPRCETKFIKVHGKMYTFKVERDIDRSRFRPRAV